MTPKAPAVLLGCVLVVGVGVAQAQELRSSEAALRNERGAALLKQGKVDEAIAELRMATRMDSRYVPALMNLAYAYDRQGRVDEAIAAYRAALAEDPENALARNNLGVLYDRQGLHDEAIRELEGLLQGDPAHASAAKNLETARRNRVIAQERDQQFARAVKEFEARPDDPRAAYAVARLYAMHGRKDEALTWLATALELGLPDRQSVSVDPALVPLRNDPRFSTLLEASGSQRPR